MSSTVPTVELNFGKEVFPLFDAIVRHASALLQSSRCTLLNATPKCHLRQRILNFKFITIRKIKSVSMNNEVQASSPRMKARGATLQFANKKPNRPKI